jgi:hypothetical protein
MDFLTAITAAAFAALALLHFYWAASNAGDAGGNSAAIPEVDGKPVFRPSRAATAGVGVVLLGTAAIVWMHVELLIAGAAAVLVLRAIGDFRLVGFFKRPNPSRFARMDTRYYSPLCLALGAALAAIAAG